MITQKLYASSLTEAYQADFLMTWNVLFFLLRLFKINSQNSWDSQSILKEWLANYK